MSKSNAAQSNEVALFQNTSPAAPPAYLQNEAPRGNEQVKQEDMAMPRLKLLQPLNPEIDAEKGINPGMLFNTITGRAIQSTYALNLHFQKEYTIFKKRELGGGFVATAKSESEATNLVAGFPGNPNDYEISESHRHILVLLDGEGHPTETVALFLGNVTGLYSSRAWNTELQTLSNGKIDRFASVWKLQGTKQSNSRGTFYVLSPEFVGWAPEALHSAATVLFTAVNAS